MAGHAMKYIHGTKTTTTKGHLNQKQQSTQSTVIDDNPVQEPCNMNTNQVFIAMANMAGKIYSDQTGRFFIQSSCGNKYVGLFTSMMPMLSCLTPLKIGQLVNCCMSSTMCMLNSMCQL